MEIRLENIDSNRAKDLAAKTRWKPDNLQKVELYRKMMESGEWIDADSYYLFSQKHYVVPLIFTDKGELWEGKHRIFALAQTENKRFKFVCVHGWREENTGQKFITGKNKFCRWGYLFYAMQQLSLNGNEPTMLEDLDEIGS